MNTLKYFVKTTVIISLLGIMSCEEFIHVDVEKSQIVKDLVFSNDQTATSALLGIYSDMYNSSSGFACGAATSVASICGLSGDELDYHPIDVTYSEFEGYSISPENSSNFLLWKSMYQSVYGANSAIEGLSVADGLTLSVQNQLMGEALFVRGFTYFYIANIFGDAPIVLSTDYRSNATLERQPVSAIYSQVIEDLTTAKTLLSNAYQGTERIRPCKAAASAMLARVHLYLGEWEKAEAESTEVIADSRFKVLADLNKVFVANSQEAIWQLRPSFPESNTNEAHLFILYEPPTTSSNPFSLSQKVVDAFEPGDARLLNWVGVITSDDDEFYYPFKYKQDEGALTEYSMVLRFSEQYLIRAEARAMLDKLKDAIGDVDTIRKRALLPLIADTNPTIGREELLSRIFDERSVELFCEWGHRWLDLKRSNRADEAFQQYPGYNSDFQLYPIPKDEFERNPQLGKQNDGYPGN